MRAPEILALCVPKDKHDHAAVARAAGVGFPDLQPIIPDLLTWLQDLNWPVSRGVEDVLVTAGMALLPHIQRILATDFDTWKYNVLLRIVVRLSPRMAMALQDDLLRIATAPTERETSEFVDEIANEILNRFIPGAGLVE